MSSTTNQTVTLHPANRGFRLTSDDKLGRRDGGGRTARPLIAIGGTHGAGREAVAANVADALCYRCYDEEILEEVGHHLHASGAQVALLDEHPVDRVAEALAGFNPQPHLHSAEYRSELEHVLRRVCERGSSVVVGHGARFVLHDRPCLRVFVTAPMAYRVRKVSEEEGVQAEIAQALVEQVDAHRDAFAKDYFDADPSHQERYSDVILNVGALGVDGATDAILAAYASTFLQTPAHARA